MKTENNYLILKEYLQSPLGRSHHGIELASYRCRLDVVVSGEEQRPRSGFTPKESSGPWHEIRFAEWRLSPRRPPPRASTKERALSSAQQRARASSIVNRISTLASEFRNFTKSPGPGATCSGPQQPIAADQKMCRAGAVDANPLFPVGPVRRLGP